MADKRFIYSFAGAVALSLALVGGMHAYRIANPPADHPAAKAAVPTLIEVEAPGAARANGVVSADEWAQYYPEIVKTMNANAENNNRLSYIDQDPYIVNLYEGFGFAKDYTSAVGHNYCLEDVAATERPHALANCLTCKTPDFTKLVNEQGLGAYSMDFGEVFSQMEESTSCYNCHGNDAGNKGQITITHEYVQRCLGEDMAGIDPAVLSCGQCHIEYYFRPEDKATTMPYDSVANMHPTAILNYYNSIGFADWIQESTGTYHLKAQHPEMETFLLGKHAATLTCVDCHMAKMETEDGTVYLSHTWESPLENETLLQSCTQCHGDADMTNAVRKIQEQVTKRETEVGQKLSDLNDKLTDAVNAGTMTEEQLNEVRSLYRSAQWYWDFCYVENAEGAHNSELANECLDTAEGLADQALLLFA